MGHSNPSFDHPLLETSAGRPTAGGQYRSDWERLPAEILTDIFLLCLPLKEDLPPSKVHAPYLLTFVCRAWYKMVIDIPKMWSTIVLTSINVNYPIPPLRLEAGARHLGMCTTRSKATPLCLYVRAEFIAHPTSLERVQRAERLQRLILIYPPFLLGPLPAFFPLSFRTAMPNLTTLEVHSRHTIATSDLAVLNRIMDSARTLKRHVFLKSIASIKHGPPVIHNTSGLEVLTLQQPLPLSVFPLILQRAPLLRKLSLSVGIISEDEPVYKKALEPLQTSTAEGAIRPVVHERLQHLALMHFECDISTIFESITLPLLQFLVVNFHTSVSTIQTSWPHDGFTAFLQRSRCKLKSFHIFNQPITPGQLLLLLRLPYLANSLEYLGIQHYAEEEQAIGDHLLEQLTLLPSTASQEGALPIPILNSKMVHADAQPSFILCPNLERFLLFVPLETFTLSKLVAMFDSRLPLSDNYMLRHKPLRHVEMDLYDGLEADLKSLREKGLVLTLSEPPEVEPMPLDTEQQQLWGYHLSEGLDDEIYDHVTGTWRTSDITLAMS